MTTAVNAVSTVITTVFNAIKALILAAWTAVQTTTTTVWDAINAGHDAYEREQAAASSADRADHHGLGRDQCRRDDGRERGEHRITTVFNAIKALILAAWTAVQTTTTTVWAAINAAVTAAVAAVKAILNWFSTARHPVHRLVDGRLITPWSASPEPC